MGPYLKVRHQIALGVIWGDGHLYKTVPGLTSFKGRNQNGRVVQDMAKVT